jgi:hypothetical protein
MFIPRPQRVGAVIGDDHDERQASRRPVGGDAIGPIHGALFQEGSSFRPPQVFREQIVVADRSAHRSRVERFAHDDAAVAANERDRAVRTRLDRLEDALEIGLVEFGRDHAGKTAVGIAQRQRHGDYPATVRRQSKRRRDEKPAGDSVALGDEI